jgi:hypothetical protein
MKHFLDAEQDVGCPLLAWFPLRKLICKIYVTCFRMYQWMKYMTSFQEIGSWCYFRIIDWKINLEFKHSTLIQPLLYKINSMPSGHTVIWISLTPTYRAWIGWEYKHASDWILLHQFIIQLQYLVSCNNLLLLVILGSNLGFIDLVSVVPHAVWWLIFVFPLKVVKKLVESFRDVIFVLILALAL